MTPQAVEQPGNNVELIWKRQFDDWLAGKKEDGVSGFYTEQDCVLCGENTFANGPDPDPDGPAAFIHLKEHGTLLTVCLHCADRSVGGADLLDRCEAAVLATAKEKKPEGSASQD